MELSQKKMKTIYFSYRYQKLIEVKPKIVRLLQIFKCRHNDLSEHFIKYDTKYKEDGYNKFYELPKTDLIVLIFYSVSYYANRIFTTIRVYNPEKYKYYNDRVGDFFKIKIRLDREGIK